MATRVVLLVAMIVGGSCYLQPTSVDLEFPHPVSSTDTCGTPAETYFDPADATTKTCDAADPSLAHPAEFVIDNDDGTWWQSKKGTDTVQLELNLTQVSACLRWRGLRDVDASPTN